MGAQMMAVVAEGKSGRIYLAPDEIQIDAAKIEKPDNYPLGEIGGDRRALWTPLYGLSNFSDLFTNRQLTALTTFSDLVAEAQQQAQADAIAAGLPDDGVPLCEGGTGARAYGEAVGVYLAFVLDRQTNYSSSINIWSGEFIVQTFARQALPMMWDYAESNPFSNSTGCWSNAIDWVCKSMGCSKAEKDNAGVAIQSDAQSESQLHNMMISTDPPYYDNIGYADLSDYFYIWMRHTLKDTYPDIFKTMLVPKAEELVATPYRFGGNPDKAKEFFENGMKVALSKIHETANENFPITIYYAFKQTETDKDNKTSSTGWETMLSAILKSGLSITATWPIRTERPTGLKAYENALASSIVLVCRKREETARTCSRRDFANALKKELKTALEALQASNIAPVDLAQAAIGPGMAIFSRYKQVLEADGSPMSVRGALQLINQELDSYFNDQDNMLDRSSRFCLDLFMQNAYNEIKFGDADVLARAKNTSVQHLEQAGVLSAEKGSVRLLERDELPAPSPDSEKIVWLLCQQLTHAMETGGNSACAAIAAGVSSVSSALEDAKNLAYRLYSFCERKGWAKEAGPYNALVTAWQEITQQAEELRRNGGAEQLHL